MSAVYEESNNFYIRNEIEGVVNKYKHTVCEDALLKDIISFSTLLYQTKRVQ